MWFDSTWAYRLPITVDNSGAAATPKDVTVDLATIKHIDRFWENVETNGEDIRVTDADGRTLETFDLASFSKSGRSGTLEVQSVAIPSGAKMVLLWVYFGKAGASTGITAFAPASPLTGYIEAGLPTTGHIISVQPHPPGATQPPARVSKVAVDEIDIWWDFSRVLQRAPYPSSGSRAYEEILSLSQQVLLAGADQAAMYDLSKARFVWTDAGRMYVRTRIKAGSSGSNYTLALRATTTISSNTAARIFDARGFLAVKDVAET